MKAGRIVHLIPAYALAHPGAGSWKACEAVGHLLACGRSEVERVVFRHPEGEDVPDEIGGDARCVLIEYTRAVSLPLRLRRRHPHLRIYSRAHNAEAYQHLSQVGPPLRPRTAYGFLRLLARDWKVARSSDALLSISDWDCAHYWNAIAGRRSRWLPYVCPWPRLRPAVRPKEWGDRARMIVSLAGMQWRMLDFNENLLAHGTIAATGQLLIPADQPVFVIELNR